MRLFTRKITLALDILEKVNTAANIEKRRITAKEIAEELTDSYDFCSQTLTQLKNLGYVRGFKGPGGGYKPTHKVATATLNDFLEDFNRDFAPKIYKAYMPASETVQDYFDICSRKPLLTFFHKVAQ